MLCQLSDPRQLHHPLIAHHSNLKVFALLERAPNQIISIQVQRPLLTLTRHISDTLECESRLVVPLHMQQYQTHQLMSKVVQVKVVNLLTYLQKSKRYWK